MKKTTTTTPSSSRCRTQKSVSYEWRPFEAPSKVPRPPPCGSTGSCATRTRRTDLHLRVCADGAFGRSLNSARTKDLTFQAPKRDFLVPDAPKTSTLCTPHKLGRDPWLLICAWGGAQTRDLAIPGRTSSMSRVNETKPNSRSPACNPPPRREPTSPPRVCGGTCGGGGKNAKKMTTHGTALRSARK